MRVGIDARITQYSGGGIRNYVIYLLDALAAVDSRTEYYVLHSRRDRTPPVPGPNFRPVSCWTPSMSVGTNFADEHFQHIGIIA